MNSNRGLHTSLLRREYMMRTECVRIENTSYDCHLVAHSQHSCGENKWSRASMTLVAADRMEHTKSSCASNHLSTATSWAKRSFTELDGGTSPDPLERRDELGFVDSKDDVESCLSARSSMTGPFADMVTTVAFS